MENEPMSESKKFRTGCAPALTVWANTSKDGEKMYFNLTRSKFDKEANKYIEDGKITLFAQDFAALAMLAPLVVAEADQHFASRRKTTTEDGAVTKTTEVEDDENLPF
jgi:hypothetical protein